MTTSAATTASTTADARQQLDAQQRALLARLAAPGTAQDDREHATALALLHKRTKSAAACLPRLAAAANDGFEPLFRDYARRTAPPEHGGPIADARAFLRHLLNRPPGTHPNPLRLAAAIDAAHIDLAWRTVCENGRPAGLARRTGPLAFHFSHRKEHGQRVVALRLGPWRRVWVSPHSALRPRHPAAPATASSPA